MKSQTHKTNVEYFGHLPDVAKDKNIVIFVQLTVHSHGGHILLTKKEPGVGGNPQLSITACLDKINPPTIY